MEMLLKRRMEIIGDAKRWKIVYRSKWETENKITYEY
jgi:hypothetical protein